MTQLRLYKKDEGKLLFDVIQNMEYLKEIGLIEKWELIEEKTLISYKGKYKGIGYGGKVKVSEYKEVYKHITDTINCYSWEGSRWN